MMHKYQVGRFETENEDSYVILEDREGEYYLVGDSTNWKVLKLHRPLFNYKTGEFSVSKEFELNHDEKEELFEIIDEREAKKSKTKKAQKQSD